MSRAHAVILAGGSGSRFWPASRKRLPKQLQALSPDPGTLIEQALSRLEPLIPRDRILIATGRHLVEPTRRVLPDLPATAFLAEPQARNTAPCIGWATEVIARRDENAIVVVLPSDQYIERPADFREALGKAIEAATRGSVVTLGIEPTRPETGYGYLRRGAEVEPGVFRLRAFVEKPDLETANGYLSSGEYCWNAGIFVFPAGLMLEHFRRHLPEMHAGLMALRAAAAAGEAVETEAIERFFAEAQSISIDFGIMEQIGRADQVQMVSADVGWSDLGSFQTAWELSRKDADGNALRGDVWSTQSRGNLVLDLREGAHGVVALVGVDDLVVVQTEDALLIARRDDCQDVKRIVEQLERAGRNELL